MTNYKKSLRNQKYRPMDEQYDQFEGQGIFGVGMILAFGVAIGCTFTMVAKGCVREPMPAVVKDHKVTLQCNSCHSKMATYFRKKGSKSPEQLAEAVLKTRNPRLLAAIHVGGEKKTPHTAMKTGHKGKYSGAWQTSENWGKISKHTSVTEQALIAEFALETHVAEEKDIVKGLNAYGGESNKKRGKYAFAVLNELQSIPK